MQTTIVYAHPYEGSLNHAILTCVEDCTRQAGETVTVLDLYADKFNPVLSRDDLAFYNQGQTTDPLVDRYRQVLKHTDKIIFIYPIWWYDMPAIMRGFLDKVLLPGTAFEAYESGLVPLYQIQETILLTTSAIPTDRLEQVFGDPIQGTMMAGTFQDVGFFHPVWHNLGGIGTISQEDINRYLATMASRVILG